jgi:hypothetical protein
VTVFRDGPIGVDGVVLLVRGLIRVGEAIGEVKPPGFREVQNPNIEIRNKSEYQRRKLETKKLPAAN